MTRPRRKQDSNPGSSALEADALTTRPKRWSPKRKEKGETDKRTQRQPKVKETDREGNTDRQRRIETDRHRDRETQRLGQCQIQSHRKRQRDTDRD